MKIIGVILTGLIGLASSCMSQTGTNVLAPESFKEKMAKTPDAIILDVRTPSEFNEGYIKNAINIDFKDSAFNQNISKLDTRKTYFVYCRSGKRSAAAAEYMRQHGFGNVLELQGGIIAWQDKKLEVIVPAK